MPDVSTLCASARLTETTAILWAIFKLLVVIDDSIKAQAAERVRQWFD